MRALGGYWEHLGGLLGAVGAQEGGNWADWGNWSGWEHSRTPRSLPRRGRRQFGGGAAEAGPGAWVLLASGSGGALGPTGRELVHTGTLRGWPGLCWGGTGTLLGCTGSLGEVMGLDWGVTGPYWEPGRRYWAILGGTGGPGPYWEGLDGFSQSFWELLLLCGGSFWFLLVSNGL